MSSADPEDWYSDYGWETRDDANLVTFIVAHYWPPDDPARQGALAHVLTQTEATANIILYDGTELTVPLTQLERKV